MSIEKIPSGAYAEPKVAPCFNSHDLYLMLESFISKNNQSLDIEHRWLAAYAQDLKLQAYNVKVGNRKTIRKQVEEFRLREIAHKKDELKKDLLRLENEEANALRAIEKASDEE